MRLSERFSNGGQEKAESDAKEIEFENTILEHLEGLTVEEKKKILEVIERDTILQYENVIRVSRLKNELSWLRRKGAIQADQSESVSGGRVCGRCRTELGRIINRGASCRLCRQRVCKQCREYTINGRDWVCLVCHKHMEIKIASGEWMNDLSKRKGLQDNQIRRPYDSNTKAALIKRSWTISRYEETEVTEKESPEEPNPSTQNSFIEWPLGCSKPRGPADENEPPWELRKPAPRSFSMSSFDLSKPSYKNPTRQLAPRRRLLPEAPDKAVTLPRQPRRKLCSLDPSRFNSMPRTRPQDRARGRGECTRQLLTPCISRDAGPRELFYHEVLQRDANINHSAIYNPNYQDSPHLDSVLPDVAREASQRAPFNAPQRNEFGGFVSSGPVTSTPISHPPLLRPPDYSATMRRLQELQRAQLAKETHHQVSRGDSVALSEPTRGWKSDTSEPETLAAPLNTSLMSLASGIVTTQRPKKSQNPAVVRRSRSFQVGSDLRHTAPVGGGHVARYVQALEKGIQMTVENMLHQKRPSPLLHSESLRVPLTSAAGDFRFRRLYDRVANSLSEDSGSSEHLDNFDDVSKLKVSSDVMTTSDDVSLDNDKIIPEGNDYKIVFISSSSSSKNSSKDSEFNSSIDSDAPSHRVSALSDIHGGGFIDESDWDYFDDSSKVVQDRRRLKVDASMMTEGAEEDGLPSVPVGQESFNTPLSQSAILPPINALNAEERRKIFEQTEIVQAEAQALQKALMGAFAPPLNKKWFRRGDSTRSSAERSLDELSCYDQVAPPDGLVQNSPALRKYRQRVLAEIQNYTNAPLDFVYSPPGEKLLPKRHKPCKNVSIQTDLAWEEGGDSDAPPIEERDEWRETYLRDPPSHLRSAVLSGDASSVALTRVPREDCAQQSVGRQPGGDGAQVNAMGDINTEEGAISADESVCGSYDLQEESSLSDTDTDEGKHVSQSYKIAQTSSGTSSFEEEENDASAPQGELSVTESAPPTLDLKTKEVEHRSSSCDTEVVGVVVPEEDHDCARNSDVECQNSDYLNKVNVDKNLECVEVHKNEVCSFEEAPVTSDSEGKCRDSTENSLSHFEEEDHLLRDKTEENAFLLPENCNQDVGFAEDLIREKEVEKSGKILLPNSEIPAEFNLAELIEESLENCEITENSSFKENEEVNENNNDKRLNLENKNSKPVEDDNNPDIENKNDVPKVCPLGEEIIEKSSFESDNKTKLSDSSSESGHSSAVESDPDLDETNNIVKINVDTREDKTSDSALRKISEKRTKRCSSSDCLLSSSDASDSTDTVEGGPRWISVPKKDIRDSDGPSSADSVLHGGNSECSDGSEEGGNLVSIVSVGDDRSYGKIYIRSDSTENDGVQIKSTCIVLTGLKDDPICFEDDLMLNSEEKCNHVMSVRVESASLKSDSITELISPCSISDLEESDSKESSIIENMELEADRSATSKLQSPIISTKERQQQYRRSPTEINECSSSLANYYTFTLGTDSPLAPRRFNKTPEVRRRKLPERQEIVDSPLSSTPTPDYSEGDLLAYEESHGINLSYVQAEDDTEEVTDAETLEDETMYESHVYDFDDQEEGGEVQFDSMEDISSGEEIYEEDPNRIPYCKKFTLHTIIEESCEESDYEKKPKEEEKSHSELEKYFFFDLGNGPAEAKRFTNEESDTETTSSIYSEGVESLETNCDEAELASSRLEKYFLSGFIGFERQPSIRSIGDDSEAHTDESGSVGSDSEGSSSPEQPRKKLLRHRGYRATSRSHSSDGAQTDGSGEGEETVEKTFVSGEDDSESEEMAFADGQCDTIKRRKKKKVHSEVCDKTDVKINEAEESVEKQQIESFTFVKKSTDIEGNFIDKDFNKIDLDKNFATGKFQSRDSGFVGSSDDLLKDRSEDHLKNKASSDSSIEDDIKSRDVELGDQKEKSRGSDVKAEEGKVSRSSTGSSSDLPNFSPSEIRTKLSRKDSFNNWSSDEETNLMMNKMRVFFKNMIFSTTKDAPKGQARVKSPLLVMFEEKLTNLMKTVPGINDDQVKEIVEYLSSEETWSDSYDSSDYTSSDLEGACALLDQADPETKSEIQEQISASCQQIIKKFDRSREPSDTDSASSLFCGMINHENSTGDISPSSKDAASMYQKLLSSISNTKSDSDRGSIDSGSQGASPPLLAKVMHHIGNRLVELMHEVSGGSENGDDNDSFKDILPVTSSPKQIFLPTKSCESLDSADKSSLTSTTFDSEDSPTDTEQSPESDIGTPKVERRKPLPVINEKVTSERRRCRVKEFPRYHQKHSSKSSSIFQTSREEKAHKYSSEPKDSFINKLGPIADDDKFEAQDHITFPKFRPTNRRPETRKAKSHMSLEKIITEDIKNNDRSESLGDLLDRVRSSEFSSSSYEQLDSDSTLKASDSLDRHIGSSSSNIRLNASSRGSLTTSSRGSLATSSRGSLNGESRGSLQGSSGAEDEDEKKFKKLSFFKYARRSDKNEQRSITLPRSTPAQILTTGTLPRSQSGTQTTSMPSQVSPIVLSTHFSKHPPTNANSNTGGPKSARYHPPGYKPPPSATLPKRSISTPALKTDLRAPPKRDDSGTLFDVVDECRTPISSVTDRRPASFRSSEGSRESPETQEEEIERLLFLQEKKRPNLAALGSRSESMASVCSAGAESRYLTVPIRGEVQLGLQYNYKDGQLEVRVLQCHDLAAVDVKRCRSDPYVKVYLLPDKSKTGKRKTKVKKHTLNPVFDEALKFTTTISELASRTLWVSVWHSDMFGRNDFLGEVLIPLNTGVILSDPSVKWYSLQERSEALEDFSSSCRGDLILALKFCPPDLSLSKRTRRSKGSLQVLVKEAKNLTATRSHATADPICKGVLLPEKGKSSKQKTGVCRKTLNPTWNCTLIFEDVSLQELTDRCLELSVWDHDRLGASHFLGGCRLNLGQGKQNGKQVDWMDASGMELKLWEQMLDRPNLWVEGSLMLRPVMDKPIYSSSFTE